MLLGINLFNIHHISYIIEKYSPFFPFFSTPPPNLPPSWPAPASPWHTPCNRRASCLHARTQVSKFLLVWVDVFALWMSPAELKSLYTAAELLSFYFWIVFGKSERLNNRFWWLVVTLNSYISTCQHMQIFLGACLITVNESYGCLLLNWVASLHESDDFPWIIRKIGADIFERVNEHLVLAYLLIYLLIYPFVNFYVSGNLSTSPCNNKKT